MKNTILRFGLITGGILAAAMLLTFLGLGKSLSFTAGMIIGYSTMIVAGIVMIVGVRSYRDNQRGGFITFGKALQVALLITLISTLFYVATWMVLSYTAMSDYMEHYTAAMMENMKNSGMPAAEMAAQQAEMEKMSEMYKNPFFRAAFTFIEPLPVGLLMSLIAALILRRKARPLAA